MRGSFLLPVVASLLFLAAANTASAQAQSCPAGLDTASTINHDFTVSFCELCTVGTVRIEIENPFRNNDDADFTDIVITEDLRASGLTYVPNSTQFTGNGVTAPPNVQPAVGGPNNSVLTWTLPGSYVLPTRPNNGGGNDRGIDL